MEGYKKELFPDIFLNAVTDEHKAIRVHDFNRRISKNNKDVCESLGIKCVTPQYARDSFISALAHYGVMIAYIDYAVGRATSEVPSPICWFIVVHAPQMCLIIVVCNVKFCGFTEVFVIFTP